MEINTGHKFLRITDIVKAKLTGIMFLSVIALKHVQKYRLLEGDIVFARTGSVGNSSLIRKVPDGAVFASYLIRLRFEEWEIVTIPIFSVLFSNKRVLETDRNICGRGNSMRISNASKLRE